MTSTEELSAILAVLKADGLLTRVSHIQTSQGVSLELSQAPEPISPVAKAESAARRDEAEAERDARIGRGHVGGFRPKLPVFR